MSGYQVTDMFYRNSKGGYYSISVRGAPLNFPSFKQAWKRHTRHLEFSILDGIF